MNRFLHIVLIIFLFAFSSCKSLSTWHLEEDELLLHRNKVKIKGKSTLGSDDLDLYIRQKPNSTVIFNWWHAKLQWKNLRYKAKEGEDNRPAVILDTTLIDKSKKQMLLALQQEGYYNAKIETKYKQLRRFYLPFWKLQKAKVIYTVYPNQQMFIDSIAYDFKDSTLFDFFKKEEKLMVSDGTPFTVQSLQSERERIADFLRTKGYYDFSDSYVRYKVDTNGAYKAKLLMQVKNPRNKNKHPRYKINRVYVYTDFEEQLLKKEFKMDTTKYREGVYMLSRDSNLISYATLNRGIFFKPGSYYNVENHNDTYRGLSNLQIFQSIKINYDKILKDGEAQMNVHIFLSHSKNKSIGAEATATFREGFGANALLSYKKRNSFGIADVFEMTVNAGFENLKSTVEDENILGLNFGPSFKFRIPGFLFMPKLTLRMDKKAVPKSGFSMRYNFQRRVDYTRHLSSVSLDYEWNQSNTMKHEISPMDLSFSFITKGSLILEKLNEFSLSQKFRFDNHINSGIKYRFIYNTQTIKSSKSPIYLVGRINLIGLSSVLLKQFDWLKRNEDNALSLAGIRYGNFIRTDIDVRKRFQLLENHQIATRFFSGAGIVFDRSSVVPFDQLYFVGGANSIRGWQQRTLGPGALNNPDNSVDRLGDVRLELNVEYRFPIYKALKSAIFTDAGNIWNINNEMEESNFNVNTFYKQIAVASGVGLRLDFDFFLFRVDFAYPIKQPFESNLWKIYWDQPNFNIGIGYPF